MIYVFTLCDSFIHLFFFRYFDIWLFYLSLFSISYFLFLIFWFFWFFDYIIQIRKNQRIKRIKLFWLFWIFDFPLPFHFLTPHQKIKKSKNNQKIKKSEELQEQQIRRPASRKSIDQLPKKLWICSGSKHVSTLMANNKPPWNICHASAVSLVAIRTNRRPSWNRQPMIEKKVSYWP